MASLLVVLAAALATRAQSCWSNDDCRLADRSYCISNKCASSKLADGEECQGSCGKNDDCAGGYCIGMICGSSLGADGAGCTFGSECAGGYCNAKKCGSTLIKSADGENCWNNDECSGRYCISNKCASSKLADGEECQGSCGKNDGCAGGYCIGMICGSSLGADGAGCTFGSECAGGHCIEMSNGGHCSSAMVAMSMAEKMLVAMRNGSAFPAQEQFSFAMIVAMGAIAGAAFAGVALHLVGRRRSSELSDSYMLSSA